MGTCTTVVTGSFHSRTIRICALRISNACRCAGLRVKRYDGVLHLITAADGARQFYKSGQVQDDAGHDVIRRETADEAVELGATF